MSERIYNLDPPEKQHTRIYMGRKPMARIWTNNPQWIRQCDALAKGDSRVCSIEYKDWKGRVTAIEYEIPKENINIFIPKGDAPNHENAQL